MVKAAPTAVGPWRRAALLQSGLRGLADRRCDRGRLVRRQEQALGSQFLRSCNDGTRVDGQASEALLQRKPWIRRRDAG